MISRIRACAIEISNSITLLVDESRDISYKEQTSIVLCYVETRGPVVERFFGVIHVADTNAITLKATIEAMLAKHGLSISRLHGQGYDRATNMRGNLMD